MMDELKACLDHWTKANLAYLKADRERYPTPEGWAPEEWERTAETNAYSITMDMAQTAEANLAHLAGDNSTKSPEELEQIASALSPGGAHDGAHLVRIVLANVW